MRPGWAHASDAVAARQLHPYLPSAWRACSPARESQRTERIVGEMGIRALGKMGRMQVASLKTHDAPAVCTLHAPTRHTKGTAFLICCYYGRCGSYRFCDIGPAPVDSWQISAHAQETEMRCSKRIPDGTASTTSVGGQARVSRRDVNQARNGCTAPLHICQTRPDGAYDAYQAARLALRECMDLHWS